MKKVLSILLLFCFSLIFSQSYKDVERISSYINQPFSKLEKEQNIKSTDRESKFGLNSKLYTYQDYVVLISETEENSLIGDIVFLPKRDVNSSERWYNICKQVESDSGYIFQSSFIANENKDAREEQLKFNMLIDILRKFNDTSSFIYYLKYKKNESYYQFGVVNDKLLIRVTSKP